LDKVDHKKIRLKPAEKCLKSALESRPLDGYCWRGRGWSSKHNIWMHGPYSCVLLSIRQPGRQYCSTKARTVSTTRANEALPL